MTAPGPSGAPAPDEAAGDRRALHGVARGGSFAAVGSAAGAALGLVLTLIVTHGLSQTSAGQFFSATAVFTVLQTLLAFGVGAGLVRFVPRLRALDQAADLPTLLRVAVVPVIATGAVASVTIWFCAPLLAERISHAHPAPLVSTFHLIGALFLPATLEIASVECTRAFGSIRIYVLLQQLGVPLLRPVLVGIGTALGAPLWAIVLLWVAPLVVALALGAIVVRRYLRELLGARWWSCPPTRPARAIASEYWAFTAARGTAMVMESLLTWLDVILVASMVSAAQAAIYAAASRFITAGTLVLQALRIALATDISAALARGQLARVSEMYRVATQWVVLASWPFYLLLALFAPTVLHIFGHSYAGGATAAAILCAAMMLNLAAGNVGTVLLMGGRSGWVLGDKTACVIVNIGLDLVLIPAHGITGAAIGWAVTILLDSALSFSQVRWGMGVGGSLRGIAVAAMLPLACFGIPGLAVRLINGSSVLALVGTALVGFALLAGPVVRWRRTLGLDVLVSAVRHRQPPADDRVSGRTTHVVA